ncbi:hypothetical protein WHT83_17935 [Aminobacter sp. P9b]|uniref:hypothetical protein n=1 Tax=Aminobacter sp. P9b TaxID=3133697 RepID=UPI0032472252
MRGTEHYAHRQKTQEGGPVTVRGQQLYLPGKRQVDFTLELDVRLKHVSLGLCALPAPVLEGMRHWQDRASRRRRDLDCD